jgi:hypothetical protein
MDGPWDVVVNRNADHRSISRDDREVSDSIMCPAPSDRLKACQLDAEILLQHAARNGKPPNDEVITTIIKMRAAVGAQDVPEELEAAFWKHFATLSSSLLPATVEGINETRIYCGGPVISWVRYMVSRLSGRAQTNANERPPEAYIAVWRYSTIALGLLILVVLAQVVAGYGAMVLGNLSALHEQRDKLKAPDAGLTQEAIEDESLSIEYQEGANIKLLRAFNSIFTPWLGAVLSKEEGADDPILVRERARISIVALNGYLMPLLIGTLGAVAHILRTLAKQISEDSYSSEARIQLRLRLVLGPLAGAAVGLIFVDAPEANGAGGTITNIAELGFSIGPFALPFIAGYSVEFFFQLVDRVIGAFSPKEE